MTLRRIKEISKQLNIEEDRVLLYHGSKSGLVGNIAPISRAQCDFGQGFYMGTDPIDSYVWAIEEDRVLLYHGSKSGLVGNIAPISRAQCDFGQGFYMGTDPIDSYVWAKIY